MNNPPCRACGSTRLNLVSVPPPCPHRYAIRCGECDCFIRWAEKPENQDKRHSRKADINRLLETGNLSDWEREFLSNISTVRKLSPKQQEIFNRILSQKGGVAR